MEIAALLVLWVAAMAFVAYSPDEVVKMALLLFWGAILLFTVWQVLAIILDCDASCFALPAVPWWPAQNAPTQGH